MSFYELGEVRPPRDSDFQYFKALCLEEDNWKRRHNKNNIQSFTRKTEISNMKMIKVSAILPDVSADDLYDALQDSEHRATWDHTMREGYVICRVSENSSIEYFGLKSPFTFANRDFVLFRAWQHNGNDYIIFNRSVFHKKSPPRTDYVRALTFITGYVITALSPSSCRFIYLTHNDPMGDIPSWAMNLATTKLAPRIMKALHRAALEYPNWKAQHSPNFKPWRNLSQQDPNIPQLCTADVLKHSDFPLKKITEKHINKAAALKEVGLTPETCIADDDSS